MIAVVLNVLVLGGMLLAAVLVLTLKDLLNAAIAFAAFSFLLAVEFYILQAPDVAIAEAGIGAALTTAILVMAVRSTRRRGVD